MLAGGALVCAASLLSAASPEAVQQAVDARVAHFKEIARASKAIKDELGQSSPNLGTVQANAKIIEARAAQIPSWFPQGSGPQAGVKTEALPAIWQQAPTFKQRAGGLGGAAHQIAAAAASGDLAATQAAAGNLGGACKACHDTFRQKK